MEKATAAEKIVETYGALNNVINVLYDHISAGDDIEGEFHLHELGNTFHELVLAKSNVLEVFVTVLETHPDGERIKAEISDLLLIKAIQDGEDAYSELRHAFKLSSNMS